MLPTLRRLAANPNVQLLNLLPHPLHLYRRILRAHRYKIPQHAREVGDKYVKNEFRLHRHVTKPEQLAKFLSEWQIYANLLEGGIWKEQKFDAERLNLMSGMLHSMPSSTPNWLANLHWIEYRR